MTHSCFGPPVGCDACHQEGRASRDAEVEEAQANYRFMVERAADQKLDGYRELGARLAASEERADALRAQLAEKEAALARVAALITHWRECAHDLRADGLIESSEEYYERAAELEQALAPASKGESDG